MSAHIVPIALAEREARVEKARRLMAAAGVDALYLEGGAGLLYFTGLRWGRSERMTAAIIPARGEIAYVCPTFEESRLRQLLVLGGDVRTWQEHHSPYELVAQVLRDRGIASGTVGIDPQVRFFLFDGIKAAAPSARFVGVERLIAACRAVKSPAEIALMQRAMDLTVTVYKQVLPTLRAGISRSDCRTSAAAAFRALEVDGAIDFQFGIATALPHGGQASQTLWEGDVVLMDGGCTVEGYHSDVSRTIVFGSPTQQQREVWDLAKRAQAAAFAAAQPGIPCEAVDAAARKVILDAGLGPEYEVPGLPHRTGHGIGLEIHEPEHMVHGNTTPLAAGMCFTDEPMIVVPGAFGIRLEDCVCVTGDGPRWFTQPSPSIEQPFT